LAVGRRLAVVGYSCSISLDKISQMKRLALAITLLILTAAAGEKRGAIVSFPSDQTAPSPDGRYVVLNVDSDKEPEHTLFLVERPSKAKRKLLVYGRYTEALWNPNSDLIAITDYAGSNVAQCLVFSTSGRAPVDIGEQITRTVRGKKERASIQENDHVYFAGIAWTSPRTLKVKVWGHGDADPSGFKRFYTYTIR
jgi:Tol biopolymer transport system component